MKVRVLNRIEISNALPLIWDVFSEYEAVNYPANGKQAFWDAIHSEEYLNMLSAYGAFDGKELIGIIAMRNDGSHVALFFVKGTYHGRGIGRELWNALCDSNGIRYRGNITDEHLLLDKTTKTVWFQWDTGEDAR